MSPDGPTATLVQHTVVPAYASKPCGSAASRYASACSCAGITATTVTAAVETVKVYTSAPDPLSECHSGDRQDCAGGRGACLNTVVGGQIDYSKPVCASLPSCNDYDNICSSSADCGAGEACVNAGAFCSMNQCVQKQ